MESNYSNTKGSEKFDATEKFIGAATALDKKVHNIIEKPGNVIRENLGYSLLGAAAIGFVAASLIRMRKH